MKDKSRTAYSLMNMGTNILGYAVNTIAGFLCRIVFVRSLASEYLGINGLFSNVLSMLSLAELGINSAIIYALYKPIAENDKKKIASIMLFYRKAYMIIGIVVAVMGLSILPFLSLIIQNPPNIKENLYLIYLLYLLNSVISYFFSYKSSLMIAMQRHYIVSGYNYVITILQSVLQIVFLITTREYLTYLLIQIICGISYNVWVSSKVSKDYPYIDIKDAEPLSKKETKDLLKNVKALAINKLSGVLVNSTDNIVITYFNGLSTVGVASNYTLFSSTLNSLVTLLFNGLTGSVGNLNATSSNEGRYSFFKILNLANFWIYGWAAIGMIFVSSDLVRLLFGEKYVLGIEIPFILALNFFSLGILHSSYTYKSTLGLFRYGQYILFFTGIINLVLDIILGKVYGVFGIYLASLLARLCTNLWYEPYAVYKYGFNKSPKLYFKRIVIYCLVFATACGLCYFACGLIESSILLNVAAKIVICSVVPNVVFIIAFRNTEEFRYLLHTLLRILKIKTR